MLGEAVDDIFDLQRFVDAQAPVFDTVLRELRAGAKRSHWMWFVFPQLAGLGHSATARHYAIVSIEEARCYLAHAVLGARLLTCTRLANSVAGRTATEIFGAPDDMKFRSCMTLFACAAPAQTEFRAALAHYFGGEADNATHRLLGE